MTDNKENVLEKVCTERHRAIDDKLRIVENRLNSHSERMNAVEDAAIKLTNMVESIAKKDFFDKILILAVFIIALVLAGMILGPDIAGKMVGGIR